MASSSSSIASTRRSIGSCRGSTGAPGRSFDQCSLRLLQEAAKPRDPRRRELRHLRQLLRPAASMARTWPVLPSRDRSRCGSAEVEMRSQVMRSTAGESAARVSLRACAKARSRAGTSPVDVGKLGTDPQPRGIRCLLFLEDFEMAASLGHVRRSVLEGLDGQHEMGVGVLGLELQNFLGPVERIGDSRSSSIASSSSSCRGRLAALSNLTALARWSSRSARSDAFFAAGADSGPVAIHPAQALRGPPRSWPRAEELACSRSRRRSNRFVLRAARARFRNALRRPRNERQRDRDHADQGHGQE